MIDRLLDLPRSQKRALVLSLDLLLMPLCMWLAFALRLDSLWPSEIARFWWLYAAAPALGIPVFIRMGTYRAVMRYVGRRTFYSIAQAVTLQVLLLGLFAILAWPQEFSRSILVIYWLVCLLVLGGVRFVGRSCLEYHLNARRSPHRVVIFGAGEAGAELAQALRQGTDYAPVAFVDDRRALHGNEVHGLTVYPTSQLALLIERNRIDAILLAIPYARRERRRKVIAALDRLPVSVKTMPSLKDLVRGRASVGDVRDLDIDDLLDLIGRSPVSPDEGLLAKAVSGKSVMVTGAGGSIGSELCRQICALRPARLVLFDISEHALYEIQRELEKCGRSADDAITDGDSIDLIPVLGSVSDEARVVSVIRAFGVQVIYHAAAYKHVPLVEHNPIAGIHNNVFGTWHVARAAKITRVETFILISTDKAVRPTNIMGAAKRMAELLVQGFAAQPTGTCFTMVRFGNVIGSSGSVVPLFAEQIAAGGPVTVTDPNVVRYFMTIPEAANLVIQAGAMARGGEVFVLDMGEPVKILDIAHRMIRLRGLQVRDEQHPNGDIAVQFTGLRPGEKLHEELLIDDNVVPTDHPLILCAQEASLPWSKVTEILLGLQAACRAFDSSRAVALLLKAVVGYRPQCAIPDPIWRGSSASGRGASTALEPRRKVR
ncbi:MAG TPA: nucleoside-diphosphate sugar epimerase/dehydratase [Gammaproteobacteria bacterium]